MEIYISFALFVFDLENEQGHVVARSFSGRLVLSRLKETIYNGGNDHKKNDPDESLRNTLNNQTYLFVCRMTVQTNPFVC